MKKHLTVKVVVNETTRKKEIANFEKMVCEKFNIPALEFECDLTVDETFDHVTDSMRVTDWFLTEYGIDVRLKLLYSNDDGTISFMGHWTDDGIHTEYGVTVAGEFDSVETIGMDADGVSVELKKYAKSDNRIISYYGLIINHCPSREELDFALVEQALDCYAHCCGSHYSVFMDYETLQTDIIKISSIL